MLADRLADAQSNAAQAKAAAAPVGNQRAQQLFNLLQTNENVKRTLQMIRSAEGTQRYAEPERVNFGNSRNGSDLSAHPRIARPFTDNAGRNLRTSATGAYQFLGSTWDGAANALGLKDFKRNSQDVAALHLIQRRGALNEAMNGDVQGLARKLGNEWASLGYNNYAQPTRKLGYLQAAFNAPLSDGGSEVNYAADKGGKVLGPGSKSGTPGDPGVYEGLDANPTLAFMRSAQDARNSPFIGDQSILQQLLQDQQAQHQQLLQSTTYQQAPTQLGAPVTFGG